MRDYCNEHGLYNDYSRTYTAGYNDKSRVKIGNKNTSKKLDNPTKSGKINSSGTTLKIDIQHFAKSSKDFPTIILPRREYAHVMSEVETNITLEQRSKKVFKKAIGDFYYTVENNGAGNYRIIGKKAIK